MISSLFAPLMSGDANPDPPQPPTSLTLVASSTRSLTLAALAAGTRTITLTPRE